MGERNHGVAVISALTVATGNRITAERISSYFSDDYNVHLRCISSFATVRQFHDFVSDNCISVVIALHVFKTGWLLEGLNVPYVFVFGGTDVNSEHQDESIRNVVRGAKSFVAFTKRMKTAALNIWPTLNDHPIYVQPQGVNISKRNSSYGFAQLFSDHGLVFLLVSGIREVKDPMFFVDAFKELRDQAPGVVFVIIGPELDAQYTMKVKDKIKTSCGCYMFPPVPQDSLHSLMTDSVAVVNSSLDEGMASALLEAMSLGVVIIARNNEGNSELIKHEHNGLLFSDRKDFISQAKKVLMDATLRCQLIQNGRRYVEQWHDWGEEKDFYLQLVRGCLS